MLTVSALCGAILFSVALSRRRERLSDIAFYIPLFLLVTVTNPLFSHNGQTPLFFLNGNAVTLEALFYGVGLAVAVCGVMLWCKCFGKIMTADKTLYLFGKTLPKISVVISCAMRFIPLFKRRLKKVSRAQKAMGLYSSKGIVDRVRGACRVFVSMIAWSLESSMQTAMSMKARGSGLSGRTRFSLFRFYPRDGVLLAATVCLVGLSVVGSALGAVDFYYYPKVSQIPLSPLSVAVYIAFAALSLIPFAVEIKEAIVWKYSVSKI